MVLLLSMMKGLLLGWTRSMLVEDEWPLLHRMRVAG
jgi:hypothetical protein